MTDIYQDGTYIKNNPSLHEEDSEYKFRYIREMLAKLSLKSDFIRILDVGGGAGILAAHVCRYFSDGGARVECHAFDLSPEMLSVQRRNNPYITLATPDFDQIRLSGGYDLTLLIDVIEHITDDGQMADEVDQLSNYILYNIPTEKNLLDWMRNLYMGGRYYKLQTASLGHVHFFSAAGARSFVTEHHDMLSWVFPDFPGHLLESKHPDCIRQRGNGLRHVELLLSHWIYIYFRLIAPWIIQGSIFILAKSRRRNV